MNKIIRRNNFNYEEYEERNKDALRWARKNGTFQGGEEVIIYNKDGEPISGAKYSSELRDYYRMYVGEKID